MNHQSQKSVLFVCIGNICRSPYAEALFRREVGDDVIVESAGLVASSGLPADEGMTEVAEKNGLDLTRHRARHVRDLDLERYDLIVALTNEIARTLVDEYGVDTHRVTALEVVDPFGASGDLYRRSAAAIHEAVTRLATDW